MTQRSTSRKRPIAASALLPLFVIAGLLLGPAATATAAPAVRQAPVAAALPQSALASGVGAVTVLRAPVSSPERATTGKKKSKKKKSKKKGGLFKTLLIVLLVVVVLVVVLYGIRMALRRRSS